MTVGAQVRRELAEPLGLDLWLGLPDGVGPRLRPHLLHPHGAAHPGHPREYPAAQVPAANAVSDAHALARLHAAMISEVGGVRLLSDGAVRQAAAAQARGLDRAAFVSRCLSGTAGVRASRHPPYPLPLRKQPT